MKKIIIAGLSIATIAILTGCGGGGSSSSNIKTGTGSYQDSAVEGVNYKCGSQTGITDKDGKFTFEDGKNCEFTLAGAKLRDVSKDDLKDNVIILEDNTTVQSLLQTLDVDGNASNGITITANEVGAIKNIMKGKVPETYNGLVEIQSEVQQRCRDEYHGHIVTPEEAEKHFHKTAQNVITNLLKGKTFYSVDYSDNTGKRALVKITIDENATSASVEVLAGADKGQEKNSTIKIIGNRLISTSNDESEVYIVKEKAKYILLKEVGEDDKAVNLYYSQADAKAEYEKYLATNITKLIAGKTLYVYNGGATISTAIINSNATTIKFGTDSAEQIKITDGVIIGADGTKHIIDEITNTYIKGHSEFGGDFIFFFNKADAQAYLKGNHSGDEDNDTE